MTSAHPNQLTCKRCGEIIDDAHRALVSEKRARLGMPPSEPKVCFVCVFNAIMDPDFDNGPEEKR